MTVNGEGFGRLTKKRCGYDLDPYINDCFRDKFFRVIYNWRYCCYEILAELAALREKN
jgi:hypothetical protein